MKKVPMFLLGAMLSFGSIHYAKAQSGSPTPVSLSIPQGSTNGSLQKKAAVYMELPLPGAKKLRAKVNVNQTDVSGKHNVIGQVENTEDASFYLRATSNSIEGHVILKGSKKAYHYFTKNETTYVEEVDINSVLCIDYDKAPVKAAPSALSSPSSIAPATLKLQSLPGAKGCVLLDFDGQYVSNTPWNNGNPINAAASGMSDAEIREAFDIVKEDFNPFNINITTDSSVFLSYPQNFRQRVIITTTNTAAPGTGGVAFLGSFKWSDETPCWVYNLGGKYAGETISHEVGHTLGLLHDGRAGFAANSNEEYYGGNGVWGPIMGAAFGASINQWSKGDYLYANRQENDVEMIANFTNGIGYRKDDHSDQFASATPLRISSAKVILPENNKGIIEKSTDRDCFSYLAPTSGYVYFIVNPADRHANLNIIARLYDGATGNKISESNMTGLKASLSTYAFAGNTYYVTVESIGQGIPNANGYYESGYSNYGSIGEYYVSGDVSGTWTSDNVATFYYDCNYGGAANSVIAGSYTAYDLDNYGITHDVISSLKVNPGYTVVLYEHDNFTGSSITITADDNCLTDNGFDNMLSSMKIFYGTNIPPQVTMTPSNGDVFYTPTNVVLKSIASDEDGSISKVEFFNGTTKLGEVTSAPYNYTWNSVAAGTYYIKAVAWDNQSRQTTSTVNKITVSSYPATATFYPNANYFGTAVSLAPGIYTASDLIAKGIGEDNIESVMVVNGYEVILFKNDYAQGEATRIASNTVNLLTGGFNNTVSSLVVRPVTANLAPSVTLINPLDSAVYYGTANVNLYADFMDCDGSLNYIDFYDGATLVGTAYYPNTSYSVTLGIGSHTITAKAYDNENAFTVSKPVTVIVKQACTAPAWSSSIAYVSGNVVEQGGVKYRANWWTLNQSPSTNNGPSGSGQPWTSQGTCTSKMASYSKNVITTLYPNPSSGSFAVESEEAGTAQVLNSFGETVATFNVEAGLNEFNLSVPTGIYIIKMNNTSTKLIIK